MGDDKKPYTIRVEGNLIVVDRHGTQTAESVIEIRHETIRLMKENKKLKDMLIIATVINLPDVHAIHESIVNLKTIPYRRMAIVGKIPEKLELAREVIKTSGVSETKVKVFRSEEDARAWLK